MDRSTEARYQLLEADFVHDIIANEIERHGATYLAVRNAALKITELAGAALSTPSPSDPGETL